MEIENKQSSLREFTYIQIFWAFALFHFLLWTFLPSWYQPSPGTSDVMEAFAMAREGLMGTAKHPAFPFWFLEGIYQASGRAEFAGYFAAQCWVLLGLWSIWQLGREYLDEKIALLLVFATAAYRYFNLGSINYTTSVPPVGLWCFSILVFFWALKYRRLRYWILLGIALGLGTLSKYSHFLLIFSMLAFMCWSPKARQYWKSPGPYITTLIALLLFLPHALWVVQHDFVTIRSTSSVLQSELILGARILHPLKFLGSQIFLILPPLLGLIPLAGFFWQHQYRIFSREDRESLFARHFLTFMIFIPFLLQMLIMITYGGKMRTAYGSVLWPFLGLWILSGVQHRTDLTAIKRSIWVSFAVLVSIWVCYFVNYQCFYWISSDAARIHFPGKALGSAVQAIWHRDYNFPCPYLTGECYLCCYAAYNMPDRPSVLCYYYGLDPGKKPTAFYATDEDIIQQGGIVLWRLSGQGAGEAIPSWLRERYPTAKVAPSILTIPYATKTRLEPLRLRYAILHPSKHDSWEPLSTRP